MAEASQTSSANAAQTQAPTKASVVVDLRPFSELKTRFKKLDVDRTGCIAALANSKVLLVYDLENPDKHQNFFIPYKRELHDVNAVRWNPHYHCRVHLASAKGRDVIVWRLEDATATGVTETILRKHTSDVSDISWSQQEEHLLVSASHSIFCWDTRAAQSPVQEWKVPGVLTSHVSFNRKNSHLLASSFQNQVCIWDLRKVQKPVLTIPAHLPKDSVTSLDWSHESEYDLLTSGGGVINLWRVITATAKQLPSQPSQLNPSVDGEGAFSVLQHKHVWRQPMQKVLFAPVGQAAITSSRGFFEEKHESQTIKMWSLVPAQRFQMVNTFEAGRARIMGLSWRRTANGGYQVASLDDADHLRLHDLEEPHHRSTGVDLPAGDSSTWRDSYGSTAGSESLEGVSTSKAPALRDDIVPVVWSFSKLQSASTSKMMIETAGEDPLRELMQIEKIANRGGFGSTSNVHVDAAQKSISLVMLASAEARRPPSASVAQQIGSRGGSDAGVTDAHAPNALESDMTKYVAAARLRVTAKISQGHRSRDEHAGIQLESDEGYVLVTPSDPSSTTHIQDPLDEASLKRMQAAAGEIMHQALKSRQPRLQACLLILRRDLEERVRDVANHVAGVLPGDELNDQQAKLQLDFDRETRAVPPDFLAEGGAQDMTPGAEMAMARPDEPIVPCPRRFGATFAPNGSLVVFCSALAVVRARTDDGRKSSGSTRKQASSAYPRTYTSLLDCLQKAQRVDMEEDSQGDDGHQPHLDDFIRDDENWLRSSWGRVYAPEQVWEGQDDGMFDVERYSTEESFVEEDGEAPTSRAQDDSTRLPISHPDHSLGAGLGAQSDNDAVDRETDEDTTVGTDAGVEGELPWTPKPKEVVLVDCSRFLPGSVYLAAFYKLGPLRPPVRRNEGRFAVAEPTALGNRKDTGEDKIDKLFEPLTVDSSTRADFGAGSDMCSSGGRSRRNSLVFGSSLSLATGLPPPLSIIQRGVSATQDSAGRGVGVMARRPSVDLSQNTPGLSRQKQWESSPDFKTMRANARSTGSGLRGPRGVQGPPGAGMVVGSPGFIGGSPGRWELTKAMQRMGSRTSSVDDVVVGSPHHRHQSSELADVAEFPLHEPGVNITPPRSQALKEDGSVFSLAGGAAGGGDAGMFSPGAGLGRKPAAQNRNMPLTRKGSAKIRQSYPLPRSPCSSCGPSPPVDTPRLRLGGLNPASPADPTGPASSSPPLSDFGMDLGHSSVPTIQIASNVPPPLGRGSRSSSFCAGGGGSGGASLGFGEHGGGDGIIPGLPGLSVRGHPSGSGDYVSLESPDALHVSGNRSRSGTDLWRGGTPRTTVDEGEAPDLRPSVGHLSRHNAAVATVSGRGELASFWALMADAADKGAEGDAARGIIGSRRFPSWKSTGPRLTATILRHFETRRDPQMLASIACILDSASRDGAAVDNTQQQQQQQQQEEEEKATTYDRYLACYAERLYQWGAQGVMAEATSHQTGAFGHRSALQIPTRQRRHGMVPYLCEQGGDEPQGPFHCSVCYKAVDGEHLSCRLCGHGGHSTHIENWFRDETECSHELCTCRCLEEMTTREEID